MQLTRRVLIRLALCSLLTAIALAPFVAARPASAAVPQSPKGFDRKLVIRNAQRWVALRVPYSQTHWFQGYRQDCSGFVSMTWVLRASYPTGMFYQIAKPIPKDDLKPGDVLLNDSSRYAHVVLFERWSGPGKRYYVGYEQLSSTNRPVRRTIPYPYFRHAELYRPYRFTGLPPKPKPKPKAAPPPKPQVRSVAATRSPAATVTALAALPAEAGFPSASAVALTLAGAAGLAWGLSGRRPL